jgi:hypothetical protein
MEIIGCHGAPEEIREVYVGVDDFGVGEIGDNVRINHVG